MEKDLSPPKQGSLDLLFHNDPYSPSDLSALLPSNLTSESRNDSLTLSSIETENIPNNSSSIPFPDLPKHKGYAWVPDTFNPNQNEIIGNIHSTNIINNSRKKNHSINSVRSLNSNSKTYLQAIHSPKNDFWIDAIKYELNNMTTHQVWTPSNHPSHLRPLTTTWVFKKKTDENGNLTKFKAQLCVRGFNQKEGIGYD
ncbi:hypothetical protein O181_001937 [Austropuccinia psidii MF-1]|uniref:Reverse transcriptase Ty1/copia-type domain-containing protein n=1 Tax=Austropuccinia psidii MF-1 TaxID=1389203 RepID=A0A9Q3GDJ0_9BASI|nr:hypothetical protein [Austropuccinia psidii MF-1]